MCTNTSRLFLTHQIHSQASGPLPSPTIRTQLALVHKLAHISTAFVLILLPLLPVAIGSGIFWMKWLWFEGWCVGQLPSLARIYQPHIPWCVGQLPLLCPVMFLSQQGFRFRLQCSSSWDGGCVYGCWLKLCPQTMTKYSQTISLFIRREMF